MKMKIFRAITVPAIVAIVSLVVAMSTAPQSVHAQVDPTHYVSGTLTTACSSDPCASTSVGVIQVPGGSSTCSGNIWGTFHATGVYEITNTASNAVLVQWQSSYVTPLNGWIANTGFNTATTRAFSVYWAQPLKSVGWIRVRLSAYTAGTVSYALSCSGDTGALAALPGVTPTSSPTP